MGLHREGHGLQTVVQQACLVVAQDSLLEHEQASPPALAQVDIFGEHAHQNLQLPGTETRQSVHITTYAGYLQSLTFRSP